MKYGTTDAQGGASEFVAFHVGSFDMQDDVIQERIGDALAVGLDRASGVGAGTFGVTKETGCAVVYRADKN